MSLYEKIQEIKVVDNHCHPFLPDKEEGPLANYFSTSLLPGRDAVNRELIVYKLTLKKLAAHLGLAPDAAEVEVLAARDKAYQVDPTSYIASLFKAAGVERVLTDIGFPAKAFVGYAVEPDEFGALVPCPVEVIVRIEPIFMELMDEDLPLDDYEQRFILELEKAVAKYQPRAMKTAMAYFTGLGFHRAGREEVSASYDAFRADRGRLAAAKAFFDHLVFTTLEFCRDRALPLQIHTGFGNAPILDLTQSNPLLLFNLLGDPAAEGVPLVLLHAGYPFVREMGYLANNYPQVWADISQVTQYTGVGLASVLSDLWSMAPLSKILYGSDGLGIPELYWLPAWHARDVLADSLGDLAQRGVLSQDQALEAAKGILGGNARRLYGL